MLKSRLLIVGLLAVPACTVQYPYSAYPAQAPVDEWSPSTPHSAALTTEDGTVVVFVVDEEALAALTREARSLGRTVVQVRVSSDSWVTDTDRPASTASVVWAQPDTIVEPTPVAKSTVTVTVNEPTYTFTPTPLRMLAPASQASVAAPDKVAVATPHRVSVATPQQVAVDTTPQPRRYGWNTPKMVTPQPVVESTPEVVWVAPVVELTELVTEPVVELTKVIEPNVAIEHEHTPTVVIENQSQFEYTPATAASVGAKTKPGFNTPTAVESQPVVEPTRPTTRTVRPSGPSTQLGYTAYGAASGSHTSVRFNSTSSKMSTWTPTLLNSESTSTQSRPVTTKSSVSKKKTTSSFWGPKR